MLRLLLERSTSVASAVEAVGGLHLAGSACVALADPDDAVFVEITPGGRAVLPARVHTNHCLDPALRSRQGALDFLSDSEDRLARAAALSARGVSLEDLLADTDGGYQAIDQPSDPALEVHDRTETVVAVVIEASRCTLRIAPGRPSRTGFTQHVAL